MLLPRRRHIPPPAMIVKETIKNLPRQEAPILVFVFTVLCQILCTKAKPSAFLGVSDPPRAISDGGHPVPNLVFHSTNHRSPPDSDDDQPEQQSSLSSQQHYYHYNNYANDLGVSNNVHLTNRDYDHALSRSSNSKQHSTTRKHHNNLERSSRNTNGDPQSNQRTHRPANKMHQSRRIRRETFPVLGDETELSIYDPDATVSKEVINNNNNNDDHNNFNLLSRLLQQQQQNAALPFKDSKAFQEQERLDYNSPSLFLPLETALDSSFRTFGDASKIEQIPTFTGNDVYNTYNTGLRTLMPLLSTSKRSTFYNPLRLYTRPTGVGRLRSSQRQQRRQEEASSSQSSSSSLTSSSALSPSSPSSSSLLLPLRNQQQEHETAMRGLIRTERGRARSSRLRSGRSGRSGYGYHHGRSAATSATSSTACNLRHVTVEMLLEYFTTGRMCGSNVVRVRYGLG